MNLSPRKFPTTNLSDTLVVVPDELEGNDVFRRLADVCQAPLVAQCSFEPSAFEEKHVIACGHLANNVAIARLYNGRHCYVDTLFPGSDDYLVRSISDPYAAGNNAIVAGASSDAGLFDAVADLTKRLETSDGVVTRLHAYRLSEPPDQPDASQLEDLIARDLTLWHGGWVASPFRGGRLKSYLWHQYLDDGEMWGHLIKKIFARSIDMWREQRIREPHDYHDFFHLDQFIHLWDLVEDHPAYTEQDRHAVVEMFIDLLRHLAEGFYLKEEVNPDHMPRQNHVTFIGLNLAVGHQYLSQRYGVTEFAEIDARVERIFAGQVEGYMPNDDAGVGYVWHVPWHTLHYGLSRDDHRYLDEGHVADLCQLLAITTDNLRSEVGYGDSSGYSAFESGGWREHLWPLMACLWRAPDPTHLWLLNWLAEGKASRLHQGVDSWHATVIRTDDGYTLPGVEPALPEDLLGVTALGLPDSVLRLVDHLVPEAFRTGGGPEKSALYFNKLSIRSGFEPDDEYLLLDGLGTLCHGHEDTNAILRLSWKGRAWLADGDYIRAAPTFHNSVTVQRNGVGVLNSPGDGVVIPPLARLLQERSDADGGVVQSEVAGYNGVDWRRNLIWRKDRYIAIVDELRCNEEGDYHCRCLWRVVGDVTDCEAGVALRQGEEELFLLNADSSVREIVDDGAAWGGYAHHDGSVHVVHQKMNRHLRAGESVVFLHVFTPHESSQVEQVSPGLLRVTGGEDVRIVGVDEQGGLVDVAESDHVVSDTTEPVVVSDGSESSVGVSSAPAATAGAVEGTEPPVVADLVWRESIVDRVGAVALFQDEDDYRMLVAGTDGELVCVSIDNGSELWRVRLPSAASVLLTEDIDGDGEAEILVGMMAAEVAVLDGATGSERWRRTLKNLYDLKDRATVLRVADLEGDGNLSVLVGTAGWFVNVFTPEGDPRWAQWFRYHPITAVEAADVDGDGRAEVIVGNVYSTPLNVHEFDGSFRWSTLEQVGAEGNATTPRRGIGLTQLRLADLDDDGRQEIIYGTEDGWLYAVDPLEGDEVWQLNVVGSVISLEITDDGVMAANEFGDVYVISRTGKILAHRQVSERIRCATPSGDELALATEGGQLLWLDANCEVVGSAHVEGGEIRQLLAAGVDVVCVLEDDTIWALLLS